MAGRISALLLLPAVVLWGYFGLLALAFEGCGVAAARAAKIPPDLAT